MSDTINKVVDERDFGHARIPNELTRQYARKITKNGIAIYCALAAHSDANHSCFPSLETIAEESDTCKQTVVTYLKLLQKMRMIHIVHHRMDNSREPDVNSYVFRDKSEWQPPDVDLSLLDEYGEIKGKEVVQEIDYHAKRQLRSLRRRQQVVQEIDNRSLRDRQQVVQGVDSKNTHSKEHPPEESTVEEYPSFLSNTLARADEENLASPIESEWELPRHEAQPIPSEEKIVAPPKPKRTPAAKQPKALLAEDSKAMKLALLLRERWFTYDPTTKLPDAQWDDPKMQAWAHDMDLMLRMDQRDDVLAAQIIIAAMRNDFWRGNILSPAKVRKHFDAIKEKLIKVPVPSVSTSRQEGGNINGNTTRRTIRQAPDGPNAYANDRNDVAQFIK